MALGVRTPLFGRRRPGGILSIVNEELTTGEIFFVHSGTGTDATTQGGTPDRPFATLDYAVGQCTANQFDRIYLMPGHAETVIAAAQIDLDVAGIEIIGLGRGSLIPTFTFATAATADIDVDAANITMRNVRFVGNIDALTAGVDVNAAHFTIEDFEFVESDPASKQVARLFALDAAADFCTIRRGVMQFSDTAGSVTAILLTGCDHTVIADCSIHGNFSAACIQAATTAITDALITRNHLENSNAVDVCIELLAASTGWISYNACRIVTDGDTSWINTPGNSSLFENYGVNNNGETGKLIGTVSV